MKKFKIFKFDRHNVKLYKNIESLITYKDNGEYINSIIDDINDLINYNIYIYTIIFYFNSIDGLRT